MQIYQVGGAVRDQLLGKEPHDIDYVVVGSSIEEMLELGYIQVGGHFPVFLHPETKEEYALARKETKTGPLHTDFQFDFNKNVTLQEDLERRDFTINAMASCVDFMYNEYFYDPFNGSEDLKNKVIRAVNPEHFIEDPLRVLRGCRLAAQLQFKIHPDTINLMRTMVEKGMLNHLTKERITKEVEKAFAKGSTSTRFIQNLYFCNALDLVFPEISKLVMSKENPEYHIEDNTFEHCLSSLFYAVNYTLDEKLAVFLHDYGKVTLPLEEMAKHNHDSRKCSKWALDLLDSTLTLSNKQKSLIDKSIRFHMKLRNYEELKGTTLHDYLYEITKGFKHFGELFSLIKIIRADKWNQDIKSSFKNLLICTRQLSKVKLSKEDIEKRINKPYLLKEDLRHKRISLLKGMK